MANDHVGTLMDLAGSLNTEFDRLFSRRSMPGRVGIMLNQFSHLDDVAGMKLVAKACNSNFTILGHAAGRKIAPVDIPKPLRESFQSMLEDVRTTCAANFAALR